MRIEWTRRNGSRKKRKGEERRGQTSSTEIGGDRGPTHVGRGSGCTQERLQLACNVSQFYSMSLCLKLTDLASAGPGTDPERPIQVPHVHVYQGRGHPSTWMKPCIAGRTIFDASSPTLSS